MIEPEIALVSGAGSGIGRAVSLILAARGAHVTNRCVYPVDRGGSAGRLIGQD